MNWLLSIAGSFVAAVNQLLLSVVSFLTSWLLLLCNLMLGSLVVVGRGWGKIRGDKKFVGFWQLFRYLVAETILITVSLELLASYVRNWLIVYGNYLLGITTAMFGTFCLWFVYTADFDIRTQRKWIVPTVCYLTTIVNYMVMR